MSGFSILAVAAIYCLIAGSEAADKTFYLSELNLTTKSEFFENVATGFLCAENTRDNPCPTTFYINYTALKELPKPYFQIIGKDLNSGIVVVEQTISFCNFASMPGMDVLVQLVVDLLKDNINFEFKCPFPTGYYEIRGFPSPKGLLLTMFPFNRPQHFSIAIKTKVSKKMEIIFTLQFVVEVVELQ